MIPFLQVFCCFCYCCCCRYRVVALCHTYIIISASCHSSVSTRYKQQQQQQQQRKQQRFLYFIFLLLLLRIYIHFFVSSLTFCCITYRISYSYVLFYCYIHSSFKDHSDITRLSHTSSNNNNSNNNNGSYANSSSKFNFSSLVGKIRKGNEHQSHLSLTTPSRTATNLNENDTGRNNNNFYDDDDNDDEDDPMLNPNFAQSELAIDSSAYYNQENVGAGGDEASTSRGAASKDDEHCHVVKRDTRTNASVRRKLITVLLLCVLFMVGEIVGGILAKSIAIQTDAGSHSIAAPNFRQTLSPRRRRLP